MDAAPTNSKSKYGVLFLILVIVLVVGAAFYLVSNKKFALSVKPTQKTDSFGAPNIGREGIFISFSATATGKVTKVSAQSIEIESGKEKRAFRVAEGVFVSQLNILERISSVLIPEAYAQTSPKVSTPSAGQSLTPPSLPPPVISSSSSAQPDQPKSIKDVRIGQTVSLTLTKQNEKDDWTVTTIFVQPE